jgi:hypothetical protein
MRIAIVVIVVLGIFFAMKNSDSEMLEGLDFDIPSFGGHLKMHR